jgi:hypothetical protein
MLKLGCNWPPIVDTRNIKLSAVLDMKALYIPTEFDAEVSLMGSIFPARMWCNDAFPCCVISAQANQTRVNEYIEQGHIVNITDADVHKEWYRQSGGQGGLYMLNAYNEWRKTGWDITNGKLNTAANRGCWAKFFPKPIPPSTVQHLNIFAFAALDSIEELCYSVYYLHGCQIAVRLYQTDIDQFNAGEIWHLTGNDGKSHGGHAVFVPAYMSNGNPVCWTWKKRQEMTVEWYKARVFDTFGVVDNRNNFMANSPVDVAKMQAILDGIVNS